MPDVEATIKRHWNETISIDSPTYSQDAYGAMYVSGYTNIASGVRASLQGFGDARTVESGRESMPTRATCCIAGSYNIPEGSKVTDSSGNIFAVDKVVNSSGLGIMMIIEMRLV